MAVVKVDRARKGRVYRVRWQDDQRRWRSKSFDRKKDADAYNADIVRAKRSGTLDHLDRGKTTLREFTRLWWTQYAETNLADSTRRGYKRYLDLHLIPALGSSSLNRLDVVRIQKLQSDLIGDGVGQESARKVIVILQGILQRAVEWGYLQTNPARAVKKPPQARIRTIRPLPPETIEKMRASLLAEKPERVRDATLVSVLAYSGLRPQEALALRWSDIGAKTIRVDKAISLGVEKGTKTGKARSVRLVKPLQNDLKHWRAASGGSTKALVFPRPDGDPWNETDYRNWRRRVYRPLGDTVGIDKAQPYDLRHSFASLLFQEGKTNHADIAQQMGHNLQTLYGTYTHTIEELRGTRPQSVEVLIRAARKKVASAKAAPILPQSTRTKKK